MQPETTQFPLETMAVRAEEMEIFFTSGKIHTQSQESLFFPGMGENN